MTDNFERLLLDELYCGAPVNRCLKRKIQSLFILKDFCLNIEYWDFSHGAFNTEGFSLCCIWGTGICPCCSWVEILSILKKSLLPSNFCLVVNKTINNYKRTQTIKDHLKTTTNHQQATTNHQQTTRNDQIDLFRIPRRRFIDVNEDWQLTSLCNLIYIYLTQLMTYWLIYFQNKHLSWIRAPLA